MLLALDIGGTKLAAAWVEAGVIKERHQCAMAYDEAGFKRAIDGLVKGWPEPQQVAVATTGYIDEGKVRSVNLDIIPFWNGFALGEVLRQRFLCDIRLINDAQAAAWGEYLIRQKTEAQSHPANLLFITLSTGVGGGLVLDHQLRIGPHGLAGHVGHAGVRLKPLDDVPRCGCGRHGCLEMIASGTSLARQASAIFRRPLNSAELFLLAHQGDVQAESIINHAAIAVAEAIGGFHMIVDLSEVVIGGSVGLAAGMLARIRVALENMRLPSPPVVSAAMLGADAGLSGVIAWGGQ